MFEQAVHGYYVVTSEALKRSKLNGNKQGYKGTSIEQDRSKVQK